MNDIIFHDNPRLSDPDLVVGFSGWPDAAGISIGTVGYLKRYLPVTRFAELDADEFYDYSASRPVATIRRGCVQQVNSPVNDLYYWRGNKGRDLVIFMATEPHLRWNRYVSSVLDLAEYLKVKRVYSVGGEYDNKLPHTREPRVGALINNASLSDELRRNEIDLIEYDGPASINTLLLTACEKRHMEAVCLWACAPYYVPGHNAKVSYTVLKKLTGMLDIQIDLKEIEGAGDRLERQIASILRRNADLRRQVRRLEHQYESKVAAVPGRLFEDLIKDVERFLKRQREP